MLTIDILLSTISEYELYRRGFDSSLENVTGVLMLDASAFPEDKDSYIYISDIETLSPDVAASNSNLFFVCSASDASSLDFSLYTQFENLVILSASAHRIINAITIEYIQYKSWLEKLRSGINLQDITELASSKFLHPIAVLNSFFFKDSLVLRSEPRSEFFISLSNGQRLSSSLAKTILDTERDNFSLSKISFRDGTTEILDYPIRFNNRVIARILIEFNPDLDTPTSLAYIDDFIHIIKPFLESSDSLKKFSMNAISSLISDIIDQVITNPVEIEDRRRLFPDLVHGRIYCPIVIKFDNPDNSIPYNYISGQLERIFPKCSVAAYNSGLVVIAPKDDYYPLFSFDKEYFMELLERFDAYAGIGNSTIHMTSLRPLYIEAAATARLGKIFCSDKSERIFYYKDYCMYFYVDMCIESAVTNHSIKSLSYLCDPGVIGLLRYDKKHDTGLFNTLKVYCDCGRNASLCAQKLFSHRNTIQKRLSQIEKLIGASLSDPTVIKRMDFSIKIIEYQVKYLKLEPTDISGIASPNFDWSEYRSIVKKPF